MEGFLNPEEVLNNLEIRGDMTAVEFGCGAGIFAFALAKKLKQGRVYGLDVQEEKLSALKNKALLDKLTNVVTIHCDLEAKAGSTLHKNFVDIVLIPNVYLLNIFFNLINLTAIYKVLGLSTGVFVTSW